jgi:putative membrane protein
MQTKPELNTYASGEKLILRDYLAADRTKMANERTLLAYLRTMIGFAASGVALIKILDEPWAVVAGYICLVLALVWIRRLEIGIHAV